MPNREDVLRHLDAYLAAGYRIERLGGRDGDDWQEIRIIMRRPLRADHMSRGPRRYPVSGAHCDLPESERRPLYEKG